MYIHIYLYNKKVIKGINRMTQVTSKLTNQQIIEAAKQRYESEKRSKLPSELIKLPSFGKVYPKHHPLHNGEIEIRYMTAYDEDILTNVSYIETGVVFDKLLESIIMTPISINDIVTSDKDALIVHARRLAYGPEYPVVVQDPKTKKDISATINLNLLKNKPFELESDENGEFSYSVNNNTVLKFKYSTSSLTDPKITEFLKNIITEVNGKRDSESIDAFIRYEFFAADAKTFRKFVVDNAPGLDFLYEFEGEDGSTFSSTFPIGPDFFWF